jgi:hypothetical protein
MSARRALLVLIAGTVACAAVPLRCPGQPQTNSTARRNRPGLELRKLGEAIAKAVLDKNVEALLGYDRADSRAQDGVSLKNTKSDLYCYIFDTECITWGNGDWRSVYEKMSQAHPLQIKVSLNSSRADGQLYGTLLFYDAASISDSDLRIPDFLCKEAPARVASWQFRLERGKWKAVTPLFDSETLGACPSTPQED